MEEKSKTETTKMKKIVVIGPESTGKSTLSEQLANHYTTDWVPEYARAYLLQHGMKYTYDDLLTIAKGQIALEEKHIAAAAHSPFTTDHSPLFIDTNMYVMKVWCEFVYGKCHPWILDQIAERKYDLYLLCNVDLPWIKDELREYPDLLIRQQLYNIYKDILIDQPVPWIDISGNYDERLQKAVKAVDELLQR
jgi:NadR type nicotinamide-nucleotide adenylyltransferase